MAIKEIEKTRGRMTKMERKEFLEEKMLKLQQETVELDLDEEDTTYEISASLASTSLDESMGSRQTVEPYLGNAQEVLCNMTYDHNELVQACVVNAAVAMCALPIDAIIDKEFDRLFKEVSWKTSLLALRVVTVDHELQIVGHVRSDHWSRQPRPTLTPPPTPSAWLNRGHERGKGKSKSYRAHGAPQPKRAASKGKKGAKGKGKGSRQQLGKGKRSYYDDQYDDYDEYDDL